MMISRIVRGTGLFLGMAMSLLALASTAHAKPEYAAKENVKCNYCHVVPGGDRNFRGLYYGTHDHSFAAFDEEFEAKAAGVAVNSVGPDGTPTVASYPNVKVPAVLDFTLKNIDGKPVKLARYAGKVVIIVNVASKCGNTPQYAGLEKLYEKYKDKGLVILGFPANEFGQQEPGTDKEIKVFCTETYNVKFPMFSKIVVKGEKEHPLYKFLTDEKTDPKFSGDIKWNFAKFLINRKGEIVGRIEPGVDLLKNDDIVAQIEKLLDEPKPESGNTSAR